jgi:biofilm PGA synthesis protein PgaA
METRIDCHRGTHPRFSPVMRSVFLFAVLILSGAFIDPIHADTTRPSADIVLEEARSCVRRGDFPQALSLLAPYAARPEEFPTLFSDYVVVLTWAGRSDDAMALFESLPPSVPRRPYLLRNMAKAYFDRGKFDQAAALYAETLAMDPQDPTALEGWTQAMALKAEHSNDAEKQYGQALVLERQGLFWDAAQIYEGISADHPEDQTAVRLQLRALSELGATSVAERLAERMLPLDQRFGDALRHNAAVDRMHWEQYTEAMQRLSLLEKEDDRYASDYIVALFKAEQYTEAIRVFERLICAGVTPHDRAKSAAAGAYLAEKQPEHALSLYNQVLSTQPASWDARVGKLYALQTLRRWKEADAWLAYLDDQTPDTLEGQGRSGPNPEKFELSAARAWYLAHQNRMGDAEAAFAALQTNAPADLEVRNALAHIHLWRGWPRRSEQDFDILETLAPDYDPAMTGRTMMLNTLAEKAPARALAADLLERKPDNKYVQQTHRMLQVEQMKEWRSQIDAHREDSDATDFRIRTALSAPLSLKTRVFGFLLWRRTHYKESSAPESSSYFRRTGIGLDHIVNADWRLKPVVSVNYDDGKEPGVALHVDYTPTDHWSFAVFGDSFSTSIDGRARASGIDAALFGAQAVWRQSEWRQAGLWYTRSVFSDDNVRDELSAGYEQNLWAKHDWRMRVFLDLYTTWNSRGDQTVYFNPERATGITLTHMTEQTVWDMYLKSFLHRLYLSAGFYQQQGYGGKAVGALRYEQVHAFSDRHALQAGVGVGRSVYDGEAVVDLRLDMVYQWRF